MGVSGYDEHPRILHAEGEGAVLSAVSEIQCEATARCIEALDHRPSIIDRKHAVIRVRAALVEVSVAGRNEDASSKRNAAWRSDSMNDIPDISSSIRRDPPPPFPFAFVVLPVERVVRAVRGEAGLLPVALPRAVLDDFFFLGISSLACGAEE